MSTDGSRGAARRSTVAPRGRFLRLGLLAAILTSVFGGKCDRQGPEFFGVVSVPGTGSILGIVTVDVVARPDAVVTLRQNGNTVDTFVTDEDGRFAFPNLQPGSYTLSTTIPGVQCDEASAQVEADQLIEVDLSCSTPTTGTVGGRVTVNGAGEAGVSVLLREGMTTLATTTTDAAGGYQFSGVAPGGKVLEIQPPEGANCPLTQRSVTITAGQTTTADFVCTRT